MNILITGAFAWTEDDRIRLSSNGKNRVFYVEREDESVPYPCSLFDIVICNWLFHYQDIKNFINLKFVQLLSAGEDRINLPYVREHRIRLYNARGVYSIPISEFVVGNVLSVLKRQREMYENQKLHLWKKYRNLGELNGKTVLICGTGSIGSEVGRKFRAFTDYVIGFNRSGHNQEQAFQAVYPIRKLNEFLPGADIIILSLPLTDETQHLIGQSSFSRMKDDVIFVNVARGAVIDEAALYTFLTGHPEAHAVLDVFESEPLPPDNPLWNQSNALIFPHNSFVSDKNEERLRRLIFKNMEQEMMLQEIRKQDVK